PGQSQKYRAAGQTRLAPMHAEQTAGQNGGKDHYYATHGISFSLDEYARQAADHCGGLAANSAACNHRPDDPTCPGVQPDVGGDPYKPQGCQNLEPIVVRVVKDTCPPRQPPEILPGV